MESLRVLGPIFAAFAVLVGVMVWAFDGLLERRDNPNLALATGPGAAHKIVLKRNPYGRYLVPGEINGHPVTFLVDTGADHVAVPAAVAAQVGLQPGAAMQVSTAGGVATTYRTRIDHIAIGGIEMEGIGGSISPTLAGDEVLLGNTFLRHVDFYKQGDRLIIEPGSGG